MELPASLKPIKAYLEQAKLRASDPIIAYHCKLYALQEAMKLRASIPKADMGFILTLMDSLEKEKATLGDLEDASALCENYAQDLFTKADDADRAGNYTLQTAKDFLAAAQLMEVCKQFGELPSDLLEKIKYGKWRFVELCKAAKERRAPPPPKTLDPPPAPADGGSEGGMGGPSDASAPPPVPGLVPPGAAPATPPPVAAIDSFGGVVPPPGSLPPAPDYFGLPPPPPQDGLMPGGEPAVSLEPPSVAMPQPPSYSALPAAPPTVLPAAPPTVPAMPPPPPYAAPPTAHVALAPTPGYQPSRPQIMEALKMSQNAVAALQFQDVDTAVTQLTQALQMLTRPPQPQE